jgi:hypothetical protein
MEAVVSQDEVPLDEVDPEVRGDVLLELETIWDDCVGVKLIVLESTTVELTDTVT